MSTKIRKLLEDAKTQNIKRVDQPTKKKHKSTAAAHTAALTTEGAVVARKKPRFHPGTKARREVLAAQAPRERVKKTSRIFTRAAVKRLIVIAFQTYVKPLRVVTGGIQEGVVPPISQKFLDEFQDALEEIAIDFLGTAVSYIGDKKKKLYPKHLDAAICADKGGAMNMLLEGLADALHPVS